MADKVKEVAIGEADRIKTLTTDAARSGAYLYPLRVSILLFSKTCYLHNGFAPLVNCADIFL